MMAYKQVLMGELMAQNRPSIARSGDGKGERRKKLSHFVSGLPFLPHHNPFQIPLLNGEYIVC